jgi:hypothetical protein
LVELSDEFQFLGTSHLALEYCLNTSQQLQLRVSIDRVGIPQRVIGVNKEEQVRQGTS